MCYVIRYQLMKKSINLLFVFLSSLKEEISTLERQNDIPKLRFKK